MSRTDARVRYTRRVIKESFLTLLREKPVNRITVKEVCEAAGINRATFYSHYSDCFALMESIERELLDEFARSLSNIGVFDVSSLVEAIYEMVEKHEEACRVLIFGGASRSLLSSMILLAREPGIAAWRKQLIRATDAELEMLYTHLSNGLMHVVVDGYDKYTREEVVSFIDRIARSSLDLFR